ncbi:SprT family protein [Streptococcus sp. H49]|uniref:SprT family protein n=1 Tax=Streptococcus huangxiaojuni TaxID=3237239 RepID=UPI0034A5082F
MNLTDYVQEVSQEDFGKDFKHQALWNRRLRTTGGRFFPSDGHLEFNYRLYQELGPAVFRKIVRHELCHYHLFYANKGYGHRDADFKKLLEKVGGLRYTPPLPSQAAVYCYACRQCGHIYQRRRRINPQNYVCGQCRGKLISLN